MWHLSKLEIEAWIVQKTKVFGQEENRDLRLNLGKWLDKYVYSDIHETFFGEFPIFLNKWLSRLNFQKTNFQVGELESWTPELIQRLKSVNNKIS